MDDIMNAELTDILKANNIEIPVSGGGGLQSIGPGMYLFTMPDGSVTVTAEPDEGYELDSLKVLDKNGKELELTDKGDGRFTFIMPAGRVEVKAAFTEEAKISPFRDVPTDA